MTPPPARIPCLEHLSAFCAPARCALCQELPWSQQTSLCPGLGALPALAQTLYLPPLSCVWQCFAVRSLGWVEMTEEELAPGRSSVAVNNCIRQLSYHKNNLHDPMSGGWGEVRA